MVMTGAEWNRITSEWIGRACARRSFAGSLASRASFTRGEPISHHPKTSFF